MARNRIKIAYITNNAARKATYKKRKMGLVKKVSELSTLCGVEACVVIYSPTCDSQPEDLDEKLRKKNRKKDLAEVMSQNVGGNGLHIVKKEDLDELGSLIDQKLKYINKRIHMLIKPYAF